jgi:PAS domain S-box-containing protein
MLTEDEVARLGRTLVYDIPDAVVYTDDLGIIRYWNKGAARIFGYSETEALGHSLDIIIPETLRQRHWDGYRRMMATGESRHSATELLSVPAQTKSGATVSIQFTVAPVRDESRKLCGIVALLRDITRDYLEMKRLRSTRRSSEDDAHRIDAAARTGKD